MRMRIAALVLVMGAATVPAANAQSQHHPEGAETEAPDQPSMMNMHDGQSMMRKGSMMGMMMGQGGMMASSPMAIVDQKEVLGLDESQIERLGNLADQAAEMRQAHMESMRSLRTDALGVLTDDQRSKLDSEMSGTMQNRMMQGERIMSCSMTGGMKEDT